MGSFIDHVPIRLTRRYREAQDDETFKGWLGTQEAAMQIVFPIEDIPEVRNSMYSIESLAVIEAKLLGTFASKAEAFAQTPPTLAMRYVYYIGETFRRHLEGSWVSIPRETPPGATIPGVDSPYTEGFVRPTDLVGLSLVRRSGNEISTVFGYKKRAYDEWIAAGRPERVFLGTLREEG